MAIALTLGIIYLFYFLGVKGIIGFILGMFFITFLIGKYRPQILTLVESLENQNLWDMIRKR